ncbi:hypothetical protein [Deminuibacter soli]|uniref:Uncharacterized protein n=1 Tax=Deminuibacter soli TaxID=2291815 RepID=A0A3E1NQ41_9BACT|nr:hypothetical protein [Deminuibacter soli]RFM30046.1 hypothetical protein DXN05_03480 [Deminuibacter soli]
MAILNYTTKIDSHKTVSEIQQLLAKNGASKIILDHNANGDPVALTFCLSWNGSVAAYILPCNYDGVKRAMLKSKNIPRSQCTDAQALRVAWRIVKDWVEAQLAIIQAEIASMPEVFLPYAVTKSGNTLYKHIEENGSNLLTN